MREILFRGKRLDNGEWVQGYYLQNYEGPYICFIKGAYICDAGALTEPVYPETVGQYTGLTDKNGKKIFEGDVVKDAYVLGKVIYNTEQEDFDGAASFMIDDIFDGPQSYRFWSSVEVIGNIHDNPELIGGANNENNI